ncbi:hypothetical protein [Corynebacterium phocae]|uniref:hypothetical protein n=1 Tax=Corynebacterium phocae TaxID=161895 RepID=UPI00095134F9|nr:hypothetical protein [Corynebacterium phocae]KAA8721684.1 hypothetical protein F4V58_10590 [Corynebacterium phocae]
MTFQLNFATAPLRLAATQQGATHGFSRTPAPTLARRRPDSHEPVGDLDTAKDQLQRAFHSRPVVVDIPAAAVAPPLFEHTTAQAASALRRYGLTVAGAADILEDAERTPGREGRTCFWTGDFYAVVDEPASLLIAWQPQTTSPRPQCRKTPGAKRGGRRDTRRPLPTTRRDYVAALESFGFVIRDGRKHSKITHPDFPGNQLTMPKTASDYRWIANNARDIRMVFGVDIRTSTPEKPQLQSCA